MRSMQWQLGMLGTLSRLANRNSETKKYLCRDGRSQDLPNTDFQPAVRHLKYKKKTTHTQYNNTHKMTTIHTRQLQQYTQDNYNNTHKTTTTIHTVNQQQLHKRQLKTMDNTCETNYNTTCTEGKNTQARQYCVQLIVIVFFQSLIHSRFHPSPSLLITYYSYKPFP